MKVSSNTPLPTYQVLGNKLLIHWNEQIVERPNMDNEATQNYEYDEARSFTYDTRDQLISKIINSVYSVADEIATINNKDTKPQEYADYQAFRVQAKALADGWIERA
jgi:hypothetical protein